MEGNTKAQQADFDPFLGSLWSHTGSELLSLLGDDTEIKVTAPPRDVHTISETSRVLKIESVMGESKDEKYRIILSHR